MTVYKKNTGTDMSKNVSKRMSTARLTRLAMLAAAAMILSYIEALIPFYAGVPGIKLGLANLIVVILLYSGTFADAFMVSCIRIVLTALLFGNLYSMLFSLSGGMVSLLVMWLLRKLPGFGPAGVSIAGGVAHNMAQLAVAVVVVETYQLAVYFPILLAAGALTGSGIGILAVILLERGKRFWNKKELR